MAPVILEDEADNGQQDRQRANEEKPPANGNAERRQRAGQADEQRPPAVRAEEAELADALVDLALVAVLRPLGQAAAGEQYVEAGQERQADRQRQRRRAGRIMREVPVDQVGGAE